MSASDDAVWLLSKQPVWSDVVLPVLPQNFKVSAPRHSPYYTDLLRLLAAVMASGEQSMRVLDLAAALIKENSANYTAWDLRWTCLSKLVEDEGPQLLDQELDFIEMMAPDNSKNYQLWNHRRKCAFAIGSDGCELEMRFTHEILEEDAKHYHAWSHRQAIISAFGLWQQELDFTATMIKQDVMNGSAWNSRMQAMLLSGALTRPEARAAEIAATVLPAVQLSPSNKASYNYLRGLYSQASPPVPLSADDCVLRVAEAALAVDRSAAPAIELLADYHAELATSGAGTCAEAAQQASSLFRMLEAVDPIQRNYWMHRQAEIAQCCVQQQ